MDAETKCRVGALRQDYRELWACLGRILWLSLPVNSGRDQWRDTVDGGACGIVDENRFEACLAFTSRYGLHTRQVT